MQSKLQNLNLTYKCLLELNLYLFKKREINMSKILTITDTKRHFGNFLFYLFKKRKISEILIWQLEGNN
jgi:hypothetical protein